MREDFTESGIGIQERSELSESELRYYEYVTGKSRSDLEKMELLASEIGVEIPVEDISEDEEIALIKARWPNIKQAELDFALEGAKLSRRLSIIKTELYKSFKPTGDLKTDMEFYWLIKDPNRSYDNNVIELSLTSEQKTVNYLKDFRSSINRSLSVLKFNPGDPDQALYAAESELIERILNAREEAGPDSEYHDSISSKFDELKSKLKLKELNKIYEHHREGTRGIDQLDLDRSEQLLKKIVSKAWEFISKEPPQPFSDEVDRDLISLIVEVVPFKDPRPILGHVVANIFKLRSNDLSRNPKTWNDEDLEWHQMKLDLAGLLKKD